MKQLEADKGSNAARKTTDNGAKSEGGLADLGYSIYAFPKEGPAESNTEVKITKSNESVAIVGDNLGTSIGSYTHQKAEINEETGK